MLCRPAGNRGGAAAWARARVGVGCGVASGGALGREPASDWPPEGTTQPTNAALA